MADIKFTDQEISFVAMALARVDPTGLIAEAEAIKNKIRQYAEERNREQMALAAAEAETDE